MSETKFTSSIMRKAYNLYTGRRNCELCHTLHVVEGGLSNARERACYMLVPNSM